MSSKHWLAVLAAMLLLASCDGPRLTAEEAGFAKLEQAAFDSCMCKREGRSEEECNTLLENEREAMLDRMYGVGVRPLESEGPSVTACAPISTTVECFAFADGGRCLATEYHVNGASGDIEHPYVCTRDEARAVEQAFEDGWLGPDGKQPDSSDEGEWSEANKRAFTSLDAMLNRILSGEGHPPTHAGNGCAG